MNFPPAGTSRSFAYDAVGNLLAHAQGGRTYTMTYTDRNELLSKADPFTYRTDQYGYDPGGRRTSMSGSDGSLFAYGYDGANRQTAVANRLVGGTTTISYDDLGRETGRHLANGAGTTANGYSPAGDLTLVTNHAGAGIPMAAITYGYDLTGHRTSAVDSVAGTSTTWGYDGLYQLTSESMAVGTETVYAKAYGYDAAGNRTAETDAVAATSTSYDYTLGNRLTSAATTGAAGGGTAVTYANDLAGNRTLVTGPGGASHYAYAADGRLTQVQVPSASGPTLFEYNALGQRAAKVPSDGADAFYAYDGPNLLAEHDAGGEVVRLYTFAAEGDGGGYGDLISEYLPHGGAATTSSSSSSSSGSSSSALPLRPAPSSSSSSSSSAAGLRKLGPVPSSASSSSSGLPLAGVPVSSSSRSSSSSSAAAGGGGSGVAIYHQFDAPQSTSSLLYDGGAPAARYAYQAFGLPASGEWDHAAMEPAEGEASGFPQGHPYLTAMAFGGKKGYYLDPELQLYMLGMGGGGGTHGRFYDPAVGRFLSDDPTRQAGGDLNVQRYVGNDPVNKLDASGHGDDETDKLINSLVDQYLKGHPGESDPRTEKDHYYYPLEDVASLYVATDQLSRVAGNGQEHAYELLRARARSIEQGHEDNKDGIYWHHNGSYLEGIDKNLDAINRANQEAAKAAQATTRPTPPAASAGAASASGPLQPARPGFTLFRVDIDSDGSGTFTPEQQRYLDSQDKAFWSSVSGRFDRTNAVLNNLGDALAPHLGWMEQLDGLGDGDQAGWQGPLASFHVHLGHVTPAQREKDFEAYAYTSGLLNNVGYGFANVGASAVEGGDELHLMYTDATDVAVHGGHFRSALFRRTAELQAKGLTEDQIEDQLFKEQLVGVAKTASFYSSYRGYKTYLETGDPTEWQLGSAAGLGFWAGAADQGVKGPDLGEVLRNAPGKAASVGRASGEYMDLVREEMARTRPPAGYRPQFTPSGGNLQPVAEYLERLAKANLRAARKAAVVQRIKESIPTYASGDFEPWFDKLTPTQLDEMWKYQSLRSRIKDQLLGPGGEHEYLMRETAPTWKRWGVTARDLREKFSVSFDELDKVAKFTHVRGLRGVPAPNSGVAHIQLRNVIESSRSLAEFRKNIVPWAKNWLNNGTSDLPIALRQ